jgi:hypothetical protein
MKQVHESQKLYVPLKFWFSRSGLMPNMPCMIGGGIPIKLPDNVFNWCACSSDFIQESKFRSKSEFLNLLMTDLTTSDDHLVLPKPISEYAEFEDEYVIKVRSHLEIPIANRTSIYTYILEFELTDVYDYLLMNYLENAGYMDHGSGIRCGWKA